MTSIKHKEQGSLNIADKIDYIIYLSTAKQGTIVSFTTLRSSRPKYDDSLEIINCKFPEQV